jgi:hypothetical protein
MEEEVSIRNHRVILRDNAFKEHPDPTLNCIKEAFVYVWSFNYNKVYKTLRLRNMKGK